MTTEASITPVVVRLKLSLLRNGLKQSGGRRAAYIVSAVVVVLFGALQLLGLIALHGNAHALSVVALLVAVLALGWAVMPLFFPSGDETLDPTRLVMLPLRPRPLVRALLAASLVGIGPLFTRKVQPFLAVGSGEHMEAFLTQEALHEVAHHRLVIDHQHRARMACCLMGDFASVFEIDRQANGKRAAPARLTGDADIAAHQAAQPSAQREAKPRAPIFACGVALGL